MCLIREHELLKIILKQTFAFRQRMHLTQCVTLFSTDPSVYRIKYKPILFLGPNSLSPLLLMIHQRNEANALEIN